MRSYNYFLILGSWLLILFSSCQKEELPVPAHNAGNVITATVNMNNDYRYQVFYDLKTNTIVSKNLKTTWDLGFETSADGYHVILNTAKAMYASRTTKTDFITVTDTSGFSANKKWDEPTGSFDSTAIGDWKSNNYVYIIDRGYSETGAHQGFRKIQFQNVGAVKYTVRFSELNGNGDVTLEINKDSKYNFMFLSFNTKSTVIVEPPKADWDIVFTQYLHVYHNNNPPSTYLVTGCLLNRFQTAAIMDSLKTFSKISFYDMPDYILSVNLNAIGYTWKKYDYNTSTYAIYPQMNYIVKDNEGIYYKLHFIDFYDTSGKKGNPKWEQQQL